LNVSILNLISILFFLAIMNVAHNQELVINSIRIKLIKYSYILTIFLVFCTNFLSLFILLEIYTVIFFLYLIGFDYERNKNFIILQHDLSNYLFTSLLSTLFFIIGLYFIIYDLGVNALNYSEMKLLLQGFLDYQTDLNIIRGLFLILIALFIKIGLAPFQGWTVRLFQRTCYQSIIYIIFFSKIILIFGAFFSILPIFINITIVLKFIGIFGFFSYILGSYLVYLYHSESEKFLAYINLTSSGFFFLIFLVDNAQNYNFAFIYFTTFLIFMNFTLLSFYSLTPNWVYDLNTIKDSIDQRKKHFISQNLNFQMYSKNDTNSFINLQGKEISRLIIHSVLASLPPTVTFFCKLFYDFSFFNSFTIKDSPYSLFLIISILTYILTIYGFLNIWKQIHINYGKILTFSLVRSSLSLKPVIYENITSINIYRKYGYLLFFLTGFILGDIQII
jgi:hypothetical protein